VVLNSTPFQNIVSVIINLRCGDSVCLCSVDFVSGTNIKINMSRLRSSLCDEMTDNLCLVRNCLENKKLSGQCVI